MNVFFLKDITRKNLLKTTEATKGEGVAYDANLVCDAKLIYRPKGSHRTDYGVVTLGTIAEYKVEVKNIVGQVIETDTMNTISEVREFLSTWVLN